MADFYSTILSSTFQVQTRFYSNQAAIAVKNESPSAPNHAERAAFADRILAGNAPFYEMSLSIASNATIRGKIESDVEYDSDLAYVVSTIYDAYAVPYEEPTA